MKGLLYAIVQYHPFVTYPDLEDLYFTQPRQIHFYSRRCTISLVRSFPDDNE